MQTSTNAFDHKHYLHVGPGGTKCHCCFPPAGWRKPEYRSAKRRAKADIRKFIAEEIA